DEAVRRYLGHGGQASEAVVGEDALQARVSASHVFGEAPYFRCTRVVVLDEGGTPTASLRSDEEITIAIDYTVLNPVPGLRLFVTLTDENQATVLRTESVDDPVTDGAGVGRGSYRSTVRIPAGLFGDARLDL